MTLIELLIGLALLMIAIVMIAVGVALLPIRLEMTASQLEASYRSRWPQ